MEDLRKGQKIALLMLSCSDSNIAKTLAQFKNKARDVHSTDLIALCDFALNPSDKESISKLGIMLEEVSPNDMKDLVQAKVSSMKLLVGSDIELSQSCMKMHMNIRSRHISRRRKSLVEREILEYVSSNLPANPTRIAGTCNLNHVRTMEILNDLVSRGFLETKAGKDHERGFAITDRGTEALHLMKKLESLSAIRT